MLDYSLLKPSIQLMLEDAVSCDPYGLSPKTLYQNIMGSLQSCSIDQVAKIFEVPLCLCLMLQESQDSL